jgi:hypothetical protein
VLDTLSPGLEPHPVTTEGSVCHDSTCWSPYLSAPPSALLMARIRSVKPEMRRSLTVSAWPIPVRWTFVGLLGYLDDYGRGLDECRLVKAELYPLDDDMTARRVDQHLAMIATGPLCRYKAAGQSYIHIPSWEEHQRVSHPSPSRIPPCPLHDSPETLPKDSGAAPERLRPSRAPAEQGAGKGAGSREQGREAAPTVLPPASPNGTALIPVVESLNQRAQRLTKAYTDIERVSNFPAVLRIAKKAMAADYSDAEIIPALERLARDGRGVTTETLRVELQGLPAPRGQPKGSTTDERVAAGLELVAQYQQEEAWDAQKQLRS